MALQVWLPLNGNMQNSGLSDVVVSSAGGLSVFANDGKIGSCLSCNGTVYHTITGASIGNNATIAWWSKTTVTGSSKNMPWCLNATNYAWTLNVWEYQFYCLNKGDSQQNPFQTDGGSNIAVLHDGKWHHFAVTFDSVYVKLYIDGVYRGKAQTYRDPTASVIKLAGGAGVLDYPNHTYDWSGSLNDFRVYDHCLTPKEVHEISRGLIVHYKLDSIDVALSKCTSVTWNQQIVYGSFSDGLTGWSHYAATVSASNHIITITKNSTGSGGLLYQVITRKNHKYYFKGTMRLVEDPGDDSTKFMTLGFSNNASVGNNPVATIRSSEWTTVSSVGVPDQSSSNNLWFGFRVGYSESPVGLQGQAKYAMLIDLTQMFGAGNEPSKEECDKIFCQDVYDNNPSGTVKNLAVPITDHSGNGWMPTVVNHSLSNIGLEGNSPRYDCYTRFGTNPYLDLESPTAEARSASFWVKIPSLPTSSSNYQIMFVDYKSRLAFGIDRSGPRLITICNNSQGTYEFKLTNFTAGQWHHVVVVNPGTSETSTSRTLYIDGVQQTAETTKDMWTHQVDALQVGRRSYSINNTENDLSDFRLYATALTQEDVLDLYHTSALVNNDGSLHTFQAKEESTEPEITATGSVITREFVEITDNDYLYLPSNVCVPITDATYAEGDVLKAKTVLRYATGGSGRDLMGLNGSGHAYWGVTEGGAWEPRGTFTYTNSDITVKNSVSYTRTVNSGENYGHYTIGALYSSATSSGNQYGYSTRNKYIYHVNLYKNGVLIKDLYPMKEGSYCGLYDIVSGTFYPCNKTTGVLGSDAVSPVLSVYKDKIETSNIIEY